MSLAIVIPAYKSKFFRESLNSLANQTNKDFKLYIGDDNSPEDLYVIVQDYLDKLDISYVKFENNIGAKNLVNQWNRCVNLIKDEKWVWLFSDDDIADENCVQLFYNTIVEDNLYFDVYRFNTRVINDIGVLICETPESPEIDDYENMAYELLMGRRGNSMPDHIFSLKKYKELGGFYKTDFASAADWANSILFSENYGIRTLIGAKVNWRLGNFNITGSVLKNRSGKIKGHLQFLHWVYKFLITKRILKDKTDIKKAVEINLNLIMRNHYGGIDLKSFFDFLELYIVIENSIFKALLKTIILYKIFFVWPLLRKIKYKIICG